MNRLRELCGPFDVEVARHLRPKTLRALHGRDNVHNVVHCTDLPEAVGRRRCGRLGEGSSGQSAGCSACCAACGNGCIRRRRETLVR